MKCAGCQTIEVSQSDYCYGCKHIICWRCVTRLGHEHGGRPHALTQKEYDMKTGPKTFYRIKPALSNMQNAWHVEHVKQMESATTTSSVGYFKTLKRAKEVVAHFKRKPIEISTT